MTEDLLCVGSIVKKFGPSDNGMVGIILELHTNDLGNSFYKVLREDGIITTWYSKVVHALGD